MKNEGRFSYLGPKGLVKFTFIIILLTVLLVFAKKYDYVYLISRKSIQDGDLSLWNNYLKFGILSVGLGFLTTILRIYSELWLEKTQKINFFAYFDGVLQTGRKPKALKKFELERGKTSTVVVSIYTLIITGYTIILIIFMKKDLQFKEIISLVVIMVLGFCLGFFRGRLQYIADSIRTEIQSRQELLSNKNLINNNVLSAALKRIEDCYDSQRRIQTIKNSFSYSGDLLKMICYFIVMYNLTKVIVNPYSHAELTYSVYGYVIIVANSISEILEYVVRIRSFSNDESIKELMSFDLERKNTVISCKENVILDNNGLTVFPGFTAKVTHSKGSSYYSLKESISIEAGNIIRLEGENQTGKSRFNRLLKDLFPDNTIMYSANTSISSILAENFIVDDIQLDYELIKEIAKKLRIFDRFPENVNDFLSTEFKEDLNSASFQLVIVTQILYFAIKTRELNPNIPQLIIFDEVLSNIDQGRVEYVVETITKIIKTIDACCIIVSHSYSEIVTKYVPISWMMRKENDKIIIEKA